MDINERKVLTNLFYYSMMVLVIGFSILFLVKLNSTAGLADYQLIIYNIWAGLVILVSILDMVASTSHRMKLLSGLLIYCLAFLYFLIGFIVFAGLSINGVISAALTDIFVTLIIFTLALTIALVIQFIVGKNMMRLAHMDEE